MGKGECSICNAPPEVFAAVNAALRKKEKLRDIEARAGFSRSALSRHGRNCLPRFVLATRKARAELNLKHCREVVSWPNGTFTLDGEPIPEQQVRPDDTLFVVTYQKTPLDKFKNPSALVSEAVSKAAAEDAARFPKLSAPLPN